MNEKHECPFPVVRNVNAALCEMWKRRADHFIVKPDGDGAIVEDGSPNPYRIASPFREIRKHILRAAPRRSLNDILAGTKIQSTHGRYRMKDGIEACVFFLAREDRIECEVFVPLKWRGEELHNTPEHIVANRAESSA